MIGRTVGHYQVVEPLRAGGMGEVWRARDLRLQRDVALKALPEEVAGDPERRARFEREARAVAALNDPHIAAIHGVEEVDGRSYPGKEAKGPSPPSHGGVWRCRG